MVVIVQIWMIGVLLERVHEENVIMTIGGALEAAEHCGCIHAQEIVSVGVAMSLKRHQSKIRIDQKQKALC